MNETRRTSDGHTLPPNSGPRDLSYDEAQLQSGPRPAPRVFYDDGAVILYCGDARDLLPTLATVDHVITDPKRRPINAAGARSAADRARGTRRALPKSGRSISRP